MAVALEYGSLAVAAFHGRAALYHAWVCAQPKRAALVYAVALPGHEVYDLVLAKFVKFAGVCVRNARNVACVFNDGYLHSKAYAEIRYAVFAGKFGGKYHAVYPARTEAARHYYTVAVFQHSADSIFVDFLGVYPFNVYVCVIHYAAVTERFCN